MYSGNGGRGTLRFTDCCEVAKVKPQRGGLRWRCVIGGMGMGCCTGPLTRSPAGCESDSFGSTRDTDAAVVLLTGTSVLGLLRFNSGPTGAASTVTTQSKGHIDHIHTTLILAEQAATRSETSMVA